MLFIMSIAPTLNQSDEIICPPASVLCKCLHSDLSHVVPSKGPALFPHSVLSSFNVQPVHHHFHKLLLQPPLQSPVPARNNLFCIHISPSLTYFSSLCTFKFSMLSVFKSCISFHTGYPAALFGGG